MLGTKTVYISVDVIGVAKHDCRQISPPFICYSGLLLSLPAGLCLPWLINGNTPASDLKHLKWVTLRRSNWCRRAMGQLGRFEFSFSRRGL